MEKTVGALFAKRLKDLMAVRPDLDTQVKLANAAQMSQTTVGRILNQKVSPTLEHVASIADAFGLTIGEIIGQEVDRKAVLHYDIRLFAALLPDQKKSIESWVEHKLLEYRDLNSKYPVRPVPVINEQRKDQRRNSGHSAPPPGEPEKRHSQGGRRETDQHAYK